MAHASTKQSAPSDRELFSPTAPQEPTPPSPAFGPAPRIYLDAVCPVCDARGMWVRYPPGPGERRALAVCPGCGHWWAV
jgi:hypothetical protein